MQFQAPQQGKRISRRSSAVERGLHKAEVAGSIPAVGTADLVGVSRRIATKYCNQIGFKVTNYYCQNLDS